MRILIGRLSILVVLTAVACSKSKPANNAIRPQSAVPLNGAINPPTNLNNPGVQDQFPKTSRTQNINDRVSISSSQGRSTPTNRYFDSQGDWYTGSRQTKETDPITTASIRRDDCSIVYGQAGPEAEDWFPGLPSPPVSRAEAVLTNGGDKEGSGYFRYTDSAQDGLMNYARARMAQTTEAEAKANGPFALRITDVQIDFDKTIGPSSLQVRFSYEFDRDQFGDVTLQGTITPRGSMTLVNVPLRQTAADPSDLQFKGQLTCADLDMRSCQNAILTLRKLGNKSGIEMQAKVIYRQGPAHIAIPQEDLKRGAALANEAKRELVQKLAPSISRSCLPKDGSTRLSTWAVANGRSGFDLLIGGLSVRGPLGLIDHKQPENLELAGGATGVSAQMIANDGGGNLNLQFIFDGQPKSHMRLSVTSMFTGTRPELQGSLPR